MDSTDKHNQLGQGQAANRKPETRKSEMKWQLKGCRKDEGVEREENHWSHFRGLQRNLSSGKFLMEKNVVQEVQDITGDSMVLNVL